MTQHSLFYYPYAQFDDAQTPLLKFAALYFDKLVLLDPREASSQTIGVGHEAAAAIDAIEARLPDLLGVIKPADVIDKHSGILSKSIFDDLNDPVFLELCEQHIQRTGMQHWTLALAKLPTNYEQDQRLRAFLWEHSRKIAERTLSSPTLRDAAEHRAAITAIGGNDTPSGPSPEDRTLNDLATYVEMTAGADEATYIETDPAGTTEYRYVSAPLSFGASIMINHAIYGSLFHANALPITDDPFHAKLLAYKLTRERATPEVQDLLQDRAKAADLKASALAAAAFQDRDIELPALHPAVPMDEVLDHREKYGDALERARTALAWVAREIESRPWTEAFEDELDRETLPEVNKELEDARKAVTDWGTSDKARLAVKAVGIGAATTAAVLSLVAVAATPFAIAAAGAAAVSGAAVPAADFILDWRKAKGEAAENGLHYLVSYKP